MENKLFDWIADYFNTPFPEAETLAESIDRIIPEIRAHSEDLREEHFYTNKPWMEVRDDENFHELVIHFFNPALNPKPAEEDGDEDFTEREYLRTTDGDVWRGKWRYVHNKILIGDEDYEETKAYELVFMDNEFMILRLLANPKRFLTEEKNKYFVLALEPLGRRMEWYDLMRYLFEKHQSNTLVYYIIAIFIAIIAIMLIS